MGPAKSCCNLRLLLFKSLVATESIRFQISVKVLQKLSGYLVPTPRAVFVQNDLPALLKRIRSIHMHIGLCAGRAVIPYHITGSLVCLHHVLFAQYTFKQVIHEAEIMLRGIDHPVRHVGAGDDKVVARKLLLHAVEWNGVYILHIHNAGNKRGCCQALLNNFNRMRCLHDSLLPVLFAYTRIDCNMVFHALLSSRQIFHFQIYFVRQPLPAVFTKDRNQFFLGKLVVLYAQGQSGDVFFLLAGLLFAMCFLSGCFRYRCIRIHFSLIKQAYLSKAFHRFAFSAKLFCI